MRLFAQKGFDRTTIDDIAEACSIAPGLIYHYFDTKLDLLSAILERYSFLPKMAEILRQPPKPTVEATLLEIAHAFLALLEERREFALMVKGEMQHNPEVAQLLGIMAKEGLKLMTRYLSERAKAGEVRKDSDFEVFTRVFFGALIEFFVSQYRLSPPLRRINPQRFITEHVRLALYGLKGK